MTELIFILIFAVMLGFPGLYIITRKIFPRGNKKTAAMASALITAGWVGLVLYLLLSATSNG